VDALIVAVPVGEGFDPLAELVKDGGTVASTVGGADVDALAARKVTATNVYAQSDASRFTAAVQLAADGGLRVPITRTVAFDELPEALGLVGKRSSRGKVAVTIA
jgi:threonine dehydrogenase-like Zn-dependent dehydrogenase